VKLRGRVIRIEEVSSAREEEWARVTFELSFPGGELQLSVPARQAAVYKLGRMIDVAVEIEPLAKMLRRKKRNK
jgi:hypothetical protein